MKAIGYHRGGEPAVLEDIELADPTPRPRDLVVEVHAISVNPVDTKVRANDPDTAPKVLGWDAAGVVRAVGSGVEMFKPGDEVWYAGDITRPGANSELHLVDERIAARKPVSLDFAAAAAMPLTAITAWELLFDRLAVKPGEGEGNSLLVIGAAGGVGSMLVQLASRLTGLDVIGTASRPETEAWARELGAHLVIDHRQGIAAELERLGLVAPRYIAALTHSEQHWNDLCAVVAPQGAIAMIDDPAQLDIGKLKGKSVSFHWELMFTRSLFQTPDMVEQHRLLTEVARLVDDGTIRTTFTESFGTITAENLRRAHQFIESGTARGKVALANWV